MPNWCSNRMYFSGEPAQIAEIKRLASGAVTPFYRRATNEGIQLFLAGSAGLLQTTEDVQFEPCPGLTAAGRGVVSPENAEAYVYALAQKMMPEYQGGFWHFIRLPDGGGYMMPDGDRFHMVNGANWFDRTVSADACGIILTSLVINRQLWLYHDSGDAGLTQLYRMRDAQLWRHIEFHPECNAIYAALD